MSEKWTQPIITKVLINTRWKLNQLIDAMVGKFNNLHPEHWKTIVAMHATEVAQVECEHMHSISTRKRPTTMQMKAIEREVVLRLVSHPARYVHVYVVVDSI